MAMFTRPTEGLVPVCAYFPLRLVFSIATQQPVRTSCVYLVFLPDMASDTPPFYSSGWSIGYGFELDRSRWLVDDGDGQQLLYFSNVAGTGCFKSRRTDIV